MMGAPLRSRRWMVLLALLAVSAWLAFFGDKTPAGLVRPRAGTVDRAKPGATMAPSTTSRTGAGRSPQAASEPVRIEALVQRRAWFEPERPVAADLFGRAAWHVVAPPPLAPAQAAGTPPPALSPTYKVAGKQYDGRQWEVFLLRDEDIFVVRSGQVIESIWRVERIEPPSMTLVHVSTGQQHRLSIGDVL